MQVAVQGAALAGVMGAWLALTATLPVLAHPPGVAEADQAVAHEIEDLREALKRAIERKDAALLRRLYADSFTHTHGSGRIDGKDARIVSALAGDPVIETAPVEELRYRVHGGHTIVVTGRSPIRSMADGQTYPFRWIAIYVRQDVDWQLAASQATRIAE